MPVGEPSRQYPETPRPECNGEKMKTLTDEQAYAAMFRFLEQFYDRTKSDDIGGLLGDMAIMPDGGNANPVVRRDWEDAIRYALDGGKAGCLALSAKKS